MRVDRRDVSFLDRDIVDDAVGVVGAVGVHFFIINLLAVVLI